MRRPSSSVFWSGYFLLILCLAVYLPPMFRVPLIRAEAMYALIPAEMLAAGHWLLATLNGVPYLDKPPLLYWLTILAYKIFGVSEAAARLPILACTLGEVWLTYLLGRRFFNPRAAWLGGFVLLSCVGFFSLHLQILIDHLITLFLLASLYCLVRWQEEQRWRWCAGFYLALAGGFMSKGFIGLAFPVLISVCYLWRGQRPVLTRLFFNPWGLALLVVAVVPWFVAVEQAHPGFLRHQIINEQVMRFLGQRQPPDIIPFPLGQFWIFFIIWLMPWTLLLPESLYRFWRETGPRGTVLAQARLLLIWPAVILGFYTLSSSRIEYYTLPALAPLALILGWRLDRCLAAPRDRSLFLPLLLIGLLSLGVMLLLPHLERICGANRREFLGMFQLIKPVARQFTFWLPGLAVLGALAAWRLPKAAVACFGALALMVSYFTLQTLLLLSPQLSDKIPGEYLRQQAKPQDLIVMESIEEFEYGASLAYYAGRRIYIVQRRGMPQFPYPVSPQESNLISPERLQELWAGPTRVFLLVDEVMPLAQGLENAVPDLVCTGKRLLVNHP